MRHDEAIRDSMRRDVEELGLAEACRRNGVHRATWYRWTKSDNKLRESDGRSDALRRRIAAIAAEHPRWGCDRIAFYLSFEGIVTSSPTVQKHLLAMGLGRVADRVAATTTGIATAEGSRERVDVSGAQPPSPDGRGCD